MSEPRIGLFPWLWRLLWGDPPQGEHECDEFTQWVTRNDRAKIVATSDGKPLPEELQYEVSYYFQERRCTLCGKVTQERLIFDSGFDYDDDDVGT